MGTAARRTRSAGFAYLLATFAFLACLAPAFSSAAPLQGKLDRSFGDGGRVRFALGQTFAHAAYVSIVRQPDGSLLVAGQTQAVEASHEPGGGAFVESAGFLRRLLPNGAADPSFHEVIEDELISGPALQPDGDIVFAAGTDLRFGEYSSQIHRLGPDGTPDRSYGKDGRSAVLPLRVGFVAVDGQGRTVVAGDAGVGGNCHDCVPTPTTAVARLLPNGALDKSFGKDGSLLLSTASFDYGITGLAVEPDGSILVSSEHAVSEVTAAGAPDPAFGKEGQVEFEGTIGALTLTTGGDPVAVGATSEGCCGPGLGSFVVRAYLPDGSPDPVWGSGGTSRIPVADVDFATAAAPTPEGGIAFAGEAAPAAEPEGCSPRRPCSFRPYVARLTSIGQVDPGFVGSLPETSGGAREGESEGPARVEAMALTPAGQVLLAGRAEEDEEATVAALGPSGAPDRSFGVEGVAADPRQLPSETGAAGFALGRNGVLALSFQTNAGAYATRSELTGFTAAGAPLQGYGGENELGSRDETPVLGSDGGGRVYGFEEHYGERGRVVRFDRDGKPDPRYGKGGRALLPKHFALKQLVVRGDGTALAVGRITDRDPMALFELTPAGRPDRRFGKRGLAQIAWQSGKRATALAASFDHRGRIVVFGSVGRQTPLARLLPNGRLDPSFADRGRLVYKPLIYLDHNALTIARDGDIYLSNSGRFRDQTIARFTPAGRPDRSFGEGGRIRVGAGLPVLRLFTGGRRLVLVSGSGAYGNSGWDLRAFHLDGRLDHSFGKHGKIAHPRSHFGPIAAVRQADGRIVLAGTRRPLESGEAVELLRFR